MSLVCSECNLDMSPSETLPGREGTIVHPCVLSLIYVPLDDGTGYRMGYVEAPQNGSLCFECIERAMPKDRKPTLDLVYSAFEAEKEFRTIDENQMGRLLPASDIKSLNNAYDKFKKRMETIESGCVLCGNDVENGKPFFVARVIDGAYSEKHLSGLFTKTNYSWSNVKPGLISFGVCFDNFRTHFPFLFERLSYELRGEDNPDSNPNLNEIYISPEFEDALKQQSGRSVDELLNEIIRGLPGVANLRIIRRVRGDERPQTS